MMSAFRVQCHTRSYLGRTWVHGNHEKNRRDESAAFLHGSYALRNNCLRFQQRFSKLFQKMGGFGNIARFPWVGFYPPA
jgi:hypothetical protein